MRIDYKKFFQDFQINTNCPKCKKISTFSGLSTDGADFRFRCEMDGYFFIPQIDIVISCLTILNEKINNKT